MTMKMRLRTLRRTHGLTQRELAAQVGVDPLTVSAWENGKRWPRPDALRQLAAVLEVKTTDLFVEDDASRDVAEANAT